MLMLKCNDDLKLRRERDIKRFFQILINCVYFINKCL